MVLKPTSTAVAPAAVAALVMVSYFGSARSDLGRDLLMPALTAAVLGGVFACGIYGGGLLYVDKVNVPAPYRMSRLLRVLVALGSVFLTVCGLVAILSYAGVVS